MALDAIRLLLFPALMAFAASSDLLTMTISNRVALGLVAGFLALALIAGMGATEIAMHFGACVVVLACGFVCFARGWIGGGDAKLAAATALWLGFDLLMPYLLYASLLGGVLTILIIRFRTLPLPSWLSRHPWIARLHEVDAGVPYGIALAAAALLVYPASPLMQVAGG
jgi:prepilin peptidase CpaA